jgi:hypothetical protein
LSKRVRLKKKRKNFNMDETQQLTILKACLEQLCESQNVAIAAMINLRDDNDPESGLMLVAVTIDEHQIERTGYCVVDETEGFVGFFSPPNRVAQAIGEGLDREVAMTESLEVVGEFYEWCNAMSGCTYKNAKQNYLAKEE